MRFRETEVITHWAVAFSKDSVSPLWKRICPGKYKHVSLLRFSAPADAWVYLDLNFSGVRAIIGPGDTEAIEIISGAMGDVDVLVAPVTATGPIVLRLFFTCVQFAKHALGVRAPFIITPDQLYAHLLANGAEVWAVRRSDAAS
jgi:hypothetical protein